MRKPKYKTLHDFMERTGTNQTRLLEMLRKQEGVVISPAMLSMILRGSRRCSLLKAWALHSVTGVPMDEIRRWPRYAKKATSRPADQGTEYDFRG